MKIIDLVADELEDGDKVEQQVTSQTNSFGVVEVTALVFVTLAVGSIARFASNVVYKIRQRYRHMIVIDCTAESPVIRVEKTPGMRGEIIVITKDGTQVDIKSSDDPDALMHSVAQLLRG